MTKKTKSEAAASHEVPGSEAYSKPKPIRYAKRHRVTVVFPDDGLTRGSFKDECDIDKIVHKFVDTGMLTHLQRGSPIFGEAPDQSLFEAAVTQAELRSHAEEGTFEEYEKSQETALEAPDDPKPAETGSNTPEGEKPSQTENQPAELASSG